MFSSPMLMAASATAGYSITNSLRFRASNSANLTRTLVAGNRNLWSLGWQGVKRGNLGTLQYLYGADTASADAVYFNASDKLCIDIAGTTRLVTNKVYRDPTAPFALEIDFDAANGTAANRIIVTDNGVVLTVFDTDTRSGITSGTAKTGTAVTAYYGRNPTSAANYFDGCLSNCWHVNGILAGAQGQIDATSGQWVPTQPVGMTNNSAGWLLEFKNATSTVTIGQDTSGNGNNWTSSGVSVTAGVTFDQSTDTPTNNFATMNNIDLSSGSTSAANMQWALNAGSARRGTFGMSSGKWYFECAITAGTNSGYFTPGIQLLSGATTGYGGAINVPSGYGYLGLNGNKLTGATGSAYGNSFTTNDVIGVAFDASAGKIWFSKNGVWQASGDPVAGTNEAFSGIPAGTYFPYVSNQTTSDNDHTGYVNFGQRPFAYTPPTGFLALNTSNLPTPAIPRGDAQFQATLRTGTGATASVTSLAFQPDLVWIKSRSAATGHGIYDSTRGVQLQIQSQTDAAQSTEATGLTAFSSSGYTVGALAQLNTNTAPYVDWAWKKGVTPGFDIVTYTGTGVAKTENHSLSAVPHMMLIKRRDSANSWRVYHRNMNATPQNGSMNLNLTNAYAADSAEFNNTAPTSSVFTVGTAAGVNANTGTFVNYLWTSIPGFSLFGSYTGNGSADGPFVWCGFKPRWVMVKAATTTGSWVMIDTARAPFNEANARVFAELSDAEVTTTAVGFDFLAGGFKARQTNSSINGSGTTYIFMAMAEAPFKTATAR